MDYEFLPEWLIEKLYTGPIAEKYLNDKNSKKEVIQKYLDRLERIEKLSKRRKHNGTKLLKKLYYNKYVIKKESIKQSYFDHQLQIALELGNGHSELTSTMRNEMITNIIEDQKKSLEIWLDYLLSDEAKYPEWFKYYVFQGMIKIGSYNKNGYSFSKRTVNTVCKFADLNKEALALVYENLVSYLKHQESYDEELKRLLQKSDFEKLYSYMLRKLLKQNIGLNTSADGIWIKYVQGSDPNLLVDGILGKGTGWCTAGKEVATQQLKGGDFYIYYTKDTNGLYTQPRIAIRMAYGEIAEIRGISEQQNLEPEMEEILNQKLMEFPDGDRYRKKVNDMKMLTKIYKKYKESELSIEELRFLYQIDFEIEGFGISIDPRIDEILSERNVKKDLVNIFECREDEVSFDSNDVISGKKIVCFYGDLVLNDIEKIDPSFSFPDYIIGKLELNGLLDIKNFVSPKLVNCLEMNLVDNIDNLEFSNRLESLSINSVERVSNVQFPNSIHFIEMDDVVCINDVVFPESLYEGLELENLKQAKNTKFPKNILECGLELPKLKYTENVVFSTNINGDFRVESLEECIETVFPKNIAYGTVRLYKKESLEGITIPVGFQYEKVWETQYLTMQDFINKSLEGSSDSSLKQQCHEFVKKI